MYDWLQSATAFVTAHRAELAFVVLVSTLLIFPILRYVRVGWKYKSEDITNSIAGPAKAIYLDKFQKEKIADPKQAARRFFQLYHRRFGRRHFIFPTILISVVIVALSTLVAETIVSTDAAGYVWKTQVPINSNSGAVAALAGAYMWVVSDFISRQRRLDFSPAEVLWGTLRLVIAIPLGLSMGAIVPAGVVPFVAFALGAFPLDTIRVMLRQLSYKQLGLELGPTETIDLLKLDGVNKELVDRLAAEDINSIAQLAYCDPIQLTMRSNLTFNAVVDLVSQSLAWVYVGEHLNALRPLGIRGAFEVRQLIDEIASPQPNVSQPAINIVPTVATALGLDLDRVWFVLRQIAFDPYTDFIYSTWS